MRRWIPVLVVAFVASLTFGVQGAAQATAGKITASSIGMNAPIVKVGVKNGKLLIGENLHVVYAWRRGDPPCDPTGTTLYAGHAWRDGDGVADKWGQLRRGKIIRVAGCRFKVIKREIWSDQRSIKPLSRVDGPPRIVLYGCKADDYSKATVVFARLI